MTRPLLAKLYPGLVLSDRVKPKDLQPGETFVAADLTKPDEVAAAVKGAHSVIHLGGHSVEGTWDQILQRQHHRLLQSLRGGARRPA